VPFRDRTSLDYLTVTPQNKDCVCLSAVMHCRVLNPQVFNGDLYEALDWVQGMLTKEKTNHHCATPEVARMFRTPMEAAEQALVNLTKTWQKVKSSVQERYDSAMMTLDGVFQKNKEIDVLKRFSVQEGEINVRDPELRSATGVSDFARRVANSASTLKRNVMLMLGGQQLEPVPTQAELDRKFS